MVYTWRCYFQKQEMLEQWPVNANIPGGTLVLITSFNLRWEIVISH